MLGTGSRTERSSWLVSTMSLSLSIVSSLVLIMSVMCYMLRLGPVEQQHLELATEFLSEVGIGTVL